MKKIILFSLVIAAFAFFATPTFAKPENAKGPAPKVAICHQEGKTGRYHLINVSENSLTAHMAHGDGYPEKAVPEMVETSFAKDCSYLKLIEEVEVSASSSEEIRSKHILDLDKNYVLEVSGTGLACNQPGCVINFDAEYSTSDPVTPWSSWVNGVASPYDSYGEDLLDLMVDGSFIDWGTYNPLHVYQYSYIGKGTTLGLLVHDLAGSYYNDSGTFLVNIFEQL